MKQDSEKFFCVLNTSHHLKHGRGPTCVQRESEGEVEVEGEEEEE